MFSKSLKLIASLESTPLLILNISTTTLVNITIGKSHSIIEINNNSNFEDVKVYSIGSNNHQQCSYLPKKFFTADDIHCFTADELQVNLIHKGVANSFR